MVAVVGVHELGDRRAQQRERSMTQFFLDVEAHHLQAEPVVERAENGTAGDHVSRRDGGRGRVMVMAGSIRRPFGRVDGRSVTSTRAERPFGARIAPAATVRSATGGRGRTEVVTYRPARGDSVPIGLNAVLVDTAEKPPDRNAVTEMNRVDRHGTSWRPCLAPSAELTGLVLVVRVDPSGRMASAAGGDDIDSLVEAAGARLAVERGLFALRVHVEQAGRRRDVVADGALTRPGGTEPGNQAGNGAGRRRSGRYC